MEEAVLIERIVAEVLKRLGERQKKAIALFTGGTIGAEAGLEVLVNLQEQGWSLQVVLTPAAERVLGVPFLADHLPGVPILTEENGCPPGALLKGSSLIMVPVLTINTAAKIAAGIADNLVTTLILHGLLMGKPVLAAKDACDIDNPVRFQLGMNRGRPALRERLHNNLKQLHHYGLQLFPASELEEAVVKLSRSTSGTAAAGKEPTGGQLFLPGQVLSRSDIASCQEREIIVPRSTVITPLARDLARERGLEIVIKE